MAPTEVLEESGRRIPAREERKGPLDNLHAYAWVVVRRMAPCDFDMTAVVNQVSQFEQRPISA